MYLLAYLIFQTGNFEAISFFGTWFSLDFHLGVREIGSAMMVLGVGNAIGSLFGSPLIRRVGQNRSLLLAILLLSALYCVLPFSPNLPTALGVLLLIMMAAGFVFPIFISTLQAQTQVARGTVSSLANAAVYVGTTIGGVVGGILLSRAQGFFGVTTFTILCYLAALSVCAWAGAFRSVRIGK
ncbi:MFS transporter [Paraburkholderia aspalathi]|uniref:MFS transporter n=1 Tax=Paraburkholderia aspalathi TaxID=1324617 RepID=UPI0038BA8A9A